MQKIETVCVIGAGVMGSGIAAQVANSKTNVILLDIADHKSGNKNKIVNELLKALIIFIIIAAVDGSAPPSKVKNLPINKKNGAPGGWPTSNLYAQAIYSPQSQKLIVGSTVNV